MPHETRFTCRDGGHRARRHARRAIPTPDASVFPPPDLAQAQAQFIRGVTLLRNFEYATTPSSHSGKPGACARIRDGALGRSPQLQPAALGITRTSPGAAKRSHASGPAAAARSGKSPDAEGEGMARKRSSALFRRRRSDGASARYADRMAGSSRETLPKTMRCRPSMRWRCSGRSRRASEGRMCP